MKYKDYTRYTDKKGIVGFFHAYYLTANYRVIFWHRLRMKWRKIPIIVQILNLIYWKVAFKRHVEIPSKCQIGDGFCIIHSGTAIINSNCVIGKNFTAVSSFNLGGVFEGDKKGSPTLGDNVYLGNNVVILGNVTIGDNVLIGANSVVLKDIPDNAVAVGSPAVVKNYNGAGDYIVRPL